MELLRGTELLPSGIPGGMAFYPALVLCPGHPVLLLETDMLDSTPLGPQKDGLRAYVYCGGFSLPRVPQHCLSGWVLRASTAFHMPVLPPDPSYLRAYLTSWILVGCGTSEDLSISLFFKL